MKREYETTLSKANVTGTSLRTAVPTEIRKFEELEAGDKAIWDVDIKEDHVEIKIRFTKKQ